MKKLIFSRKRLLAAIHAACVALFLMAAAQRSEAQMSSPPFQVSGSTVTTSSGTYVNGAGLYEPNAAYTSVSISAGTVINATTPYGGSGSYNVDPFSIVTTSASSFSNAGSVNLNGTNGSGSGNYQATVFLNQGAASITATNSGTISSQLHLGNVTQALELVSTTGNLTAINTGTLTAGSSNSAYVLETLSTVSGNISITNSASGNINTAIAGAAIYAMTQGTGTITLNNAGMLSATGGINGNAVRITGHGTGDVQVDNTGTIFGTHDGINAQANNANVIVTNEGMITGQSGAALNASTNNGNATATNSGSVVTTTGSFGVEAETGVGVAIATNTGSISGGSASGLYGSGSAVTLVNSGTITNSGSAIYVGQYNSGPIQVTNSGTITNSNSGIYVGQFGTGSITVLNSNTISSSAYGIVVHSAVGSPLTVTNTGTIDATNTGIQLFGVGNVINSGTITGGVDAITVPSGSNVTFQGNAATNGTTVGGATPASLSTLSFALSIPASQYAAARAELDAEIAAYAAQNGGDLTFVIDGRSFDISNFLFAGGITDDLTALINRLYARTPGFASLGATLDQLNTGNPQAARLLNALGNVPDSNLVNALAELSPKELEVFRNVAFDNNTFNTAQVNNHLANLRDGLTGFDSSALTVRDATMDSSLNQVRSHLLAYNPASTPGLINDSESLFGGLDMKDMRSAQVNTMPVDRWSSFIAGNVILADLNGNPNLEDANYTTGAVTAGVDYRLDDHFTVGALFAYAHTDADLDSRGSSATVDSYSPGLYASYVDGGWYGNFLGAYTRNAYTDDRNIDIAGLAGSNHGGTSGNQGSANLTGGYEFHQGAFKFGPVASMQYVHLAIQSIQEQGPTALDINEQNQDSLRTLFGFEGRFNANVATPLGHLGLTPHASLSWQHEYLNNSQGITSQFDGAGGGSFSVQTDTPDRDSAFIDIGLDVTVSKNVTVFVDYATQVGQNNFYAQSAQGGVRVGF